MGYLHKAAKFWELLRYWFPFGWIPFVVAVTAGAAVPLGGTAVLLLSASLLAGGVLLVVLLPLLPEQYAEGELQALARCFEVPGEYTLAELHRSLGIPRRRIKQLIQELLPLELYNIVYHRRFGVVYVAPRGKFMELCPRCEAQLPEDEHLKCSGCRALFSRAVVHLPYSLLQE